MAKIYQIMLYYICKIINKLILKLEFCVSLIKQESFSQIITRPENKKFQKVNNWERVATKWHLYTSPFRLSLGDVHNYKDILQRIGTKNKILLLGSTPELRDIVSQFPNSYFFVADFSLSMMKNMRFFTKYVTEFQEKWIRADWFSLDNFLKNNYFDVIMGDLILPTIEPSLLDGFLNKVSNLLSCEGFFITRNHFINKNLLKLKSDTIIAETLDKFSNFNNRIIEDLLASRLFDKNTDSKTKKIDTIAFRKNIKEYLQFTKKKRAKIVLNNILKKWGDDSNWTFLTSYETDGLLTRKFIIRDLRLSFDYPDSEFYPFYVLKRIQNS